MGSSPIRVGVGIAVAWAAAVLGTPAAAAETGQLELKRLEDRSQYVMSTGEPDYLFRRTYPQHFWTDTSRPEGTVGGGDFASVVKKEPASYQCEHPFRAVAKLGSDHYAFVLDSTGIKSKGYDLLIFDRNRNGDLTDDPVIEAMKARGGVAVGTYVDREFPRVDLTIRADGKTFDYAFFVRAFTQFQKRRGSSFMVNVSLSAAAYRQGEVVVDGKRRRIAVIDFNSNGRFDDAFEIDEQRRWGDAQVHPKRGDMLLVDFDTSDHRHAGFAILDRKERHPLSKLVCVDGRFYKLDVSAAGDTIAFTRASRGLGFVTNPNKRYEAVVYSDKGFVRISGSKAKPVPLPEGDWRLFECAIDLTEPPPPRSRPTTTASKPSDPKRDSVAAKVVAALFGRRSDRNASRYGPTRVKASGTYGHPPVKVRKGETAELPFGPPYKPTVRVAYVQPAQQARGGKSGAGRMAQLELQILGAAREICTDLMVNGNRPRAPSFEIATPKGKVIERGKFRYG